MDVEAGYLCRGDDLPSGTTSSIRRRLGSGDQQGDEQGKCAHALSESKE